MSTQQDSNAFRAQRLANTHDPLALMANTHDPLALMANTQTPLHLDQSSLITNLQHPQPNNNFVKKPSFNTNYMPQPMQNLEDSSDPITAMNKALALIAKAFKINTIPTNNNQRSSLIPRNNQIAQLDMTRAKSSKCKWLMIMLEIGVVLEISNQYGNGNVVTASDEGNGNGINDAHKETERVKVNCTLEDTLQQASTSGTQSDNAPVYDSDGSTEVPKDENFYDHDIFNMLTHEVQYTDLQTELDRTKEKLENYIIKKEKEYVVLWNNWYTKYEECKYDKISYDKAYNDMQQKVERLQAQLGDLKGKFSDTQCASNTLDPVSQKLKDENVSLEFKIPTGRIFAMCGKLTASSNTENKSEKSVCDNASTSNPSEPSSKGLWLVIKCQIATRSSNKRKMYMSVICSTNYSNGENQVVSKSSAVTTADASDKCQQQQDSTSSTSTLTTTITADGNFDL
ncbi:hypothetical protein Tco_0321584 [Tanacetum coccineum]